MYRILRPFAKSFPSPCPGTVPPTAPVTFPSPNCAKAGIAVRAAAKIQVVQVYFKEKMHIERSPLPHRIGKLFARRPPSRNPIEIAVLAVGHAVQTKSFELVLSAEIVRCGEGKSGVDSGRGRLAQTSYTS